MMEYIMLRDAADIRPSSITVVCPPGLPKAPVAMALGLIGAVRGAEGPIDVLRTNDPQNLQTGPMMYVIGFLREENSAGEFSLVYQALCPRPSDRLPDLDELAAHIDGRASGQPVPAPSWWTIGGPRGGPSVLAAIYAAAPIHVDGSPIQQYEWDEYLCSLACYAKDGFKAILRGSPAGFGTLCVYLRAQMAKTLPAFNASVSRVVPLVESRKGDPVLVLDQFEAAALDVCAALPKADGDVLYIVHPSSRGDEWMVSAVASRPGSRDCRKPLPWKPGSIIPTEATFIHPSRRFAGAKTKGAALLLARAAVRA